MKIDIKEALNFLDDPSENEGGQSTSIIGVIGEDLNAYAFKHYLKNFNGATKVEILNKVTTGKNKGKRLDRWIYVEKNEEKILYQCEIKNWAAKAIHGRRIKRNADNNSILEVANKNWKDQCNQSFSDKNYPNGVTKVFVEMKRPKTYEKIKVEPLILYWMPVLKDSNTIPLFKVSKKYFNNPSIITNFDELNVFSVSIYLRSLLEKGVCYIEDDIPNIEHRLEILNKICLKERDGKKYG